MKERERPVMEHILALVKFFQDKQAEAGEQDGLPVSSAEEIRSACELMHFMEEMPGGFLIYQADGEEEILYANQGLLRLFRCGDLKEFRELTGNSFRGLVHPEDLDAVEKSVRQQVSSDQFDLDYVEYRIIRKDGAVRWVEDYGHFVRSKTAGDIFYVLLVDATEKIDRQRHLEDSASFALNYRVVDEGEAQYLQLRFDSAGEREQPAQTVMGCRRVDEELRRELERRQSTEAPAVPPAEEELPEETPVRCRILLVEDNAFNREIETEILKSLDFPVETAGNGREAVEKLQAAGPEHFGLILMDIQMPVMNGWEATKAIRALPDPALSRIPIVALSANVFESDVQKSLELGMNAHLAKSVDVPELLGTIEAITRLEK